MSGEGEDKKKKDEDSEKEDLNLSTLPAESPIVDYKAEYFRQVLSKDDGNESVPGLKDIIFSIFKQLSIGMDLTKVMLPVELCEPRSLLEKLTDIMTHINILVKVPKIKDPLQRMVEICRWAVSGWYIRPKGAKKPFNPVLGEVFRGHWIMEDGTISTYFSEQVSHHPPISAFFGENKKHRMKMEGWYYPQSKFFGNSAGAIAAGKGRCYIQDLDEVYTFNWPDYYFRGIFWGTLKLEIGGTIEVACEKTGLSAYIKFLPKPMIGGDWYCLNGRIKKGKKTLYYISGKWSEVVYIQKKLENGKKGKKEIFFDPSDDKKDPRCPMNCLPIEDLKPYESHRKWEKLANAVKTNDLQTARDEKHRVEEEQRELRRKREEGGVDHKLRFFKMIGDKLNTKEAINKREYKFVSEDHEMYKSLLVKKFGRRSMTPSKRINEKK